MRNTFPLCHHLHHFAGFFMYLTLTFTQQLDFMITVIIILLQIRFSFLTKIVWHHSFKDDSTATEWMSCCSSLIFACNLMFKYWSLTVTSPHKHHWACKCHGLTFTHLWPHITDTNNSAPPDVTGLSERSLHVERPQVSSVRGIPCGYMNTSVMETADGESFSLLLPLLSCLLILNPDLHWTRYYQLCSKNTDLHPIKCLNTTQRSEWKAVTWSKACDIWSKVLKQSW